MTTRPRRTWHGVRRLAGAVGLLAAGLSAAQNAAGPSGGWPVQGALLRVDVELADPPSVPEAGYLVMVPDGGLLPKPACEPFVFDAEGHALAYECVWHNPKEGFGLVIARPANGSRATVYFKPAAKAPARRADASLRPGLLLYTQAGNATFEKAVSMGRQDPPGRDARMGLAKRVGHRENPFGADTDYVSYFTGWLTTPAGNIFFCSISDSASELLVNGKTVARVPPNQKRQDVAQGQFGSHVQLTAGPHRIEYYCFNGAGRPPEAQLCWKLPGVKTKDDMAELVPATAFEHSGTARIIDARLKSGTPAAVFTWEPDSYVWLGAQPVHFYRIRAEGADRFPAGTRMLWNLGKGLQSAEKTFVWPIAGEEESEIGLQVALGAESSQSVRPLYMGRTPPALNVNDKADRQKCRRALLSRCLAVPQNKPPCAGWGADFWTTLVAVSESYAGMALLNEIFERSRADLMKAAQADRWVLEDIFAEDLRCGDAPRYVPWLDRLTTEEKDPSRRLVWLRRKLDHLLYDLGQMDAARSLLPSIRALGGSAADVARGLIAAGDVERMAGDAAKAIALYSDAASSYRRSLPAVTPRPPGGAALGAVLPGDWRSGAVREGTYMTVIRGLIAQEKWTEARQQLDRWEFESPVSKLQGDFSFAEAQYYRAIRDHRRAQQLLALYRKYVETSNVLPEAMEMEVQCLVALRKAKEAAELAKDMEKRFPGHPSARRVRDFVPASGSGRAEEGRDLTR